MLQFIRRTDPYRILPYVAPQVDFKPHQLGSLGVFRVLNPARVWVINPTARCQTWLRSISSSTKTGGSKLGFSPDDGWVRRCRCSPQPKGTSPSATGFFLRVGTGHNRVLHAFRRSATRSSTLVQMGIELLGNTIMVISSGMWCFGAGGRSDGQT